MRLIDALGLPDEATVRRLLVLLRTDKVGKATPSSSTRAISAASERDVA